MSCSPADVLQALFVCLDICAWLPRRSKSGTKWPKIVQHGTQRDHFWTFWAPQLAFCVPKRGHSHQSWWWSCSNICSNLFQPFWALEPSERHLWTTFGSFLDLLGTTKRGHSDQSWWWPFCSNICYNLFQPFWALEPPQVPFWAIMGHLVPLLDLLGTAIGLFCAKKGS